MVLPPVSSFAMSEHQEPDAESVDDLDSPQIAGKVPALSKHLGTNDPLYPKPVGAPFRLATLLVGLVCFAGLVWLLLKI